MKNMRYFIIDCSITSEIKNNLSNYGNIIFTKKLVDLYDPVNTHPDIQIHFLSNYEAICCPELYDYYKTNLPESVNLIAGSNCTGRGYPADVSYNAAVFGNNLVCNFRYIDNYLFKYYLERKYKLINVNQGYTKCNICPVAENAVITEDKGIAEKLRNSDIDVCLLKYKEVNLKSFNYGFIGGATGFIDENKIAFFGDVKTHSESDKIYEFASKYNKEIVSLGNNRLMDYGGIISFTIN